MRRAQFLAWTGPFVTLTMLSATAHAQSATPPEDTEPKIEQLDPITIYATRTERSTFEVPALVTQIDTEAPGNATAGDVEDLLQFSPGVDITDSPRRNGQTVSIRGFDDESIITLLDGRRQNFESGHDGRAFIDPALLKSVEVVRGSSSSIYGGGGIGGVIAFETKDAQDLLKEGEEFGVLTNIGFRSATDEFVSTASGFGLVGNFDYLGSVSYRNSGDIEQGGNNRLDNDSELINGLFKLGGTFEHHRIEASAQLYNDDATEPNNPSDVSNNTDNPFVEKDVTDNQFSIGYTYENPENTWLKPSLLIYYNQTEVEETNFTGSNTGRVQSREYETLGLNLDNQSSFKISDNQTHTFSYGFELYRDKQNGSNSADLDDVRGGVPNAKALNFGAYIQDEISLESSIGEFLIIPAVRFDSYDSEDDIGNSQNETEFSPKIALSYLPTDNVVLFGSISRAFRAPNLTEIYSRGQHFPGLTIDPPGPPPPVVIFPDNFFVPNPDLRPETVTTFEIGAGVDFDDVFAADDTLKIKGAYHYNDGEDFISSTVNTAAGTTTIDNVPNARIFGFEIEGKYDLGNWNTKLGLSYVEAENDDTGEYLSNNVPLTFYSDVSYNFTRIDSTVGWRGRFATDNDKVPNPASDDDEVIRADGYGVHDLYFSWRPTSGDFENASFDVAVTNLFDTEYRKGITPLLQEGRSLNARLTYRW
ncbi:TonB-dependent hemoglobin/transferrin/lactoferrin family receptor [Kiloniella sp. b19]|uniref:TonB-dependent hemoglobin/transferrin/lactoferrin family receptor n=1 Tax=Kiloniella sp. GXU_MW_B19 TaxID=3141326 RepID=UPI0031E04814